MITVTQFKEKVKPKLNGTTLAKLTGSFYDKMYEAAGNLLSSVRPYSVIRRVRIENAIYDHVYNYTCQDDMAADSVIDIRPVAERSSDDDITGTYSKQFDVKKGTDTFTVEWINGVKTLRLSKNLTPRTILHRMDSLTLEGTITAGGDASGLEIDTLDFVSGSGSVKFALSGSTGQATITLALDTPIDLSDMRDLGAVFEWLKFPDVSRLTSVQLKWGSSGSVYWAETATAAHDRSFSSAGNNAWMLLRHEWVDATGTGSPAESDSEVVDYIQIVINYTAGAALTSVKLDNITAALGQAWEVVYYSNCLFTNSAGTTWLETPTADSDIIRLDGASENNAFLYEFMLTIEQELKGKNAAADIAWFRKKLGFGDNDGGLIDKMQQKYPDQSITRTIDYYNFDDITGY